MKKAFLLLIFAAAVPAAAQYAQKKDSKTEQQNLEVIRRMTEKMNRGDWRAAADEFAPDTQNHGEKVGREGVRAVLEDIFTTFPDFRMETLYSLAANDWVSVRCEVTGTHRGVGKIPVNGGLLVGVAPTGKRFAVQHIHWFRLRDAKIVEHFAARDDLGMMQQLGLLPLALGGQ